MSGQFNVTIHNNCQVGAPGPIDVFPSTLVDLESIVLLLVSVLLVVIVIAELAFYFGLQLTALASDI